MSTSESFAHLKVDVATASTELVSEEISLPSPAVQTVRSCARQINPLIRLTMATSSPKPNTETDTVGYPDQ
jgi:hypothetical protein